MLMPELPEVETTRSGIEPHIASQKIEKIIIRDKRLRWPIPADIHQFEQQKITNVARRGKYLLLQTSIGQLIIHLGMSGRIRILSEQTPVNKHDHFDITFNNNKILRYTDPRRFGAFLFSTGNDTHPLLATLGVEPLEKSFTARYLFSQIQNKSAAIKTIIMDSKVVVGVGNIYAAEALFLAGIHPLTPGKQLSLKNTDNLVKAIKQILRLAIRRGGTTLKDFSNSEGKPGYFVQQLQVYGRDGLPCFNCQTLLTHLLITQRSTVFCAKCQK